VSITCPSAEIAEIKQYLEGKPPGLHYHSVLQLFVRMALKAMTDEHLEGSFHDLTARITWPTFTGTPSSRLTARERRVGTRRLGLRSSVTRRSRWTTGTAGRRRFVTSAAGESASA
jgi:hypothetical protein